jgi:hypothetical protein
MQVKVERSQRGEGAPVNPLEPRPPGPETVMPQEWGSDRRDEECASERRSDKPLGGGVKKPPRDAGRGSL